jgi:hypothetical protein
LASVSVSSATDDGRKLDRRRLGVEIEFSEATNAMDLPEARLPSGTRFQGMSPDDPMRDVEQFAAKREALRRAISFPTPEVDPLTRRDLRLQRQTPWFLRRSSR